MPVYALPGKRPILDKTSWIAPNASVIGQVMVGAEASVWWGAVLRGDNEWIHLGEQSNIQDGAVLHTDPGAPLSIGTQVSVGHLCMVHGCTIGEASLIGIHSTILNHAIIGRECLIGAHTLIPEGRHIPDRSLVMGTPGRIIRTLSSDDIHRLREVALRYVEHAHHYASTLCDIPMAAG